MLNLTKLRKIDTDLQQFCEEYLKKNEGPEMPIVLGGILLSQGVRALLGAGLSYNQIVGIIRREVDRRIKLREQRPAA